MVLIHYHKYMNKDFKKDLYIIIGGGGGLGGELTRVILKNDKNQCLVVGKESASKTSANLKALVIDLSLPIADDNLDRILNFSLSGYKSVNLICNAGVIEPIKPLGRIQKKDIINAVNINFLNHAIIINRFIAKISTSQALESKIMVISSGAAESPNHGLGIYTSTKAALEMLTRSLFIEQKSLKRVRILAVRPGVMDTGMQKTMRESSVNDFAKVHEYQKLSKDDELLPSAKVAELLLVIFSEPKFWQKPVMDIYELKTRL